MHYMLPTNVYAYIRIYSEQLYLKLGKDNPVIGHFKKG